MEVRTIFAEATNGGLGGVAIRSVVYIVNVMHVERCGVLGRLVDTVDGLGIIGTEPRDYRPTNRRKRSIRPADTTLAFSSRTGHVWASRGTSPAGSAGSDIAARALCQWSVQAWAAIS